MILQHIRIIVGVGRCQIPQLNRIFFFVFFLKPKRFLEFYPLLYFRYIFLSNFVIILWCLIFSDNFFSHEFPCKPHSKQDRIFKYYQNFTFITRNCCLYQKIYHGKSTPCENWTNICNKYSKVSKFLTINFVLKYEEEIIGKIGKLYFLVFSEP